MNDTEKSAAENLPVRARRKVGRRSSLTPQKMRKVADLVARGNFQKIAAAACGISESSYYEYLQRGTDGEEPFATFKTMVEQALIDQETSLVEKIRLAADSDGPDRSRCAQWLLERGPARERWGRDDLSARVELGTGITIHFHGIWDDDGEPPKRAIDITPSPEQLRKLDAAEDKL